jgi:hypothetical protein
MSCGANPNLGFKRLFPNEERAFLAKQFTISEDPVRV